MNKLIAIVTLMLVVGMATFQRPAKSAPSPEPTPDPYTILPTF